MRSGFPLLALLASIALAVAAPAWALNPDAVVALHVKGLSTKNHCTSNGPSFACSQFVTEAASGPGLLYHVYIVVARGDTLSGIAGLAVGVQYDTISMFSWTKCSDLEFQGQNWPANGGGNSLTWLAATNCQRTSYGEGAQAVAGYFYLGAYQPGTLYLDERNIAIPDMKVADCAAAETDLTGLRRAAIAAFTPGAATQGCNPCVGEGCPPGPVDVLTWGRVKRAYRGRNGG